MTKRAAHYVTRTAKQICERIALGDTLQEALDHVGYLAPVIATVWRWMDEHQDFRDMYERALKFQAANHADRLLELSRDVLTHPKSSNAYRVAADILKWQAAVRDPSRFGKMLEEPGKNKPLDPAKLRAEIKRLEIELGVAESKVKPLKAVQSVKKAVS